MKILIYIKTFFTLALVLLLSGLLYSEERTGHYREIDLFDTDENFQVLGGLYKAGYFKNISDKVNLSPEKERPVTDKESLRLFSGTKKSGEARYSVFTLYALNTFNQSIRLTWETEYNDDLDDVRDESISKIMDFALRVKSRDVNQSLMESYIWSQDVKKYKVSYFGGETGSAVREHDIVFETVPSKTHRFWRALGMLFFCNSLGVANYWIAKDENMEDWEYQPDSAGVKKKMLDGWSLDTNAFRTNTIYHIYAGVVYYQAGRSNGYGYMGSTVWAFTGSLMWEYIGEYREQVSTNDMIFTTMGGVILGEAFRISSLYLEKNLSPGIIRSIAVFLLDPMRKINSALDRCMSSSIKVNLVFLNPSQVLLEKAVNASYRQ